MYTQKLGSRTTNTNNAGNGFSVTSHNYLLYTTNQSGDVMSLNVDGVPKTKLFFVPNSTVLVEAWCQATRTNTSTMRAGMRLGQFWVDAQGVATRTWHDHWGIDTSANVSLLVGIDPVTNLHYLDVQLNAWPSPEVVTGAARLSVLETVRG